MSRTDKDKPQWARDNDQGNWKGVEHSDYCLLWGCDLDEPRTATNKCQLRPLWNELMLSLESALAPS